MSLRLLRFAVFADVTTPCCCCRATPMLPYATDAPPMMLLMRRGYCCHYAFIAAGMYHALRALPVATLITFSMSFFSIDTLLRRDMLPMIFMPFTQHVDASHAAPYTTPP